MTQQTSWFLEISNRMFMCACSVAQSSTTLSGPMDCKLCGSSVRGIFQARILEWVVICPSPGDLPGSGIKPESPVSPALAGGFFTTEPPGKPHLQAIPTSNSRIHILFKCAWNVLRDDHKLGHKTSFHKFKMIETISSISLITTVWN